jgi:hypothetical protein
MVSARALQRIELSSIDIQTPYLQDPDTWKSGDDFLVPKLEDALAGDLSRNENYYTIGSRGTLNLYANFAKVKNYTFNGAKDSPDIRELRQHIFTHLELEGDPEVSGNLGGILCLPQNIYYPLAQILVFSTGMDPKIASIYEHKVLLSKEENGNPRITIEGHISAIEVSMNEGSSRVSCEKEIIPVDIDFSYQLVFDAEKRRYKLDLTSLKKGGADADVIEDALRHRRLSDGRLGELLARGTRLDRGTSKSNPYCHFMSQVKDIKELLVQKQNTLPAYKGIEFKEKFLTIIQEMDGLIYSSLREYTSKPSDQHAATMQAFQQKFALKLSALKSVGEEVKEVVDDFSAACDREVPPLDLEAFDRKTEEAQYAAAKSLMEGGHCEAGAIIVKCLIEPNQLQLAASLVSSHKYREAMKVLVEYVHKKLSTQGILDKHKKAARDAVNTVMENAIQGCETRDAVVELFAAYQEAKDTIRFHDEQAATDPYTPLGSLMRDRHGICGSRFQDVAMKPGKIEAIVPTSATDSALIMKMKHKHKKQVVSEGNQAKNKELLKFERKPWYTSNTFLISAPLTVVSAAAAGVFTAGAAIPVIAGLIAAKTLLIAASSSVAVGAVGFFGAAWSVLKSTVNHCCGRKAVGPKIVAAQTATVIKDSGIASCSSATPEVSLGGATGSSQSLDSASR